MPLEPIIEAGSGAPDKFGLSSEGGYQVTIECPVVIFAEGNAVGGMVVAGFCERDEVARINDGEVAHSEAKSRGGASIVVDFLDCFSECCGAYRVGGSRSRFLGNFFGLEEGTY